MTKEHRKMTPPDPLTPYGNRPMVTPIVNAVNYEYLSFEVLRQITDGEIDGYTYHRDDNPTVREVERKIAALEGAEDCIVCTTGMAACTMIYLTYLRCGDQLIIFHDTYGANYKVSLILERLGVDVLWLDANEADRIGEHLKPNTRMILLETPSNPLCKVIDIEAVCKAAKTVGAITVVDNTFATPYHQLPLKLGADLVVHSATKALGGHNDLMAGAIAASRERYNELWFTRQAIGTTLDAYSAFLLDRGLKTFELRAQAMDRGARAVAEFLDKHPKVSRLMYPGLPSHPSHEVAARQMHRGFGGMMAFDVGVEEEDAKRFIMALKTIYHAVSLGATETLICIPNLTTMLYLPPERRTIFGVRKNTVRLALGIEPPETLVADLKQALACVAERVATKS
ncbi:aminotransferase class I/II-fold pyridoxal phosphate-dependent enzyme [Candidatus Sumerlaeota bacterium]|nr:aminotransferase class I/II-fold pyridoxal phosphate-dependent enzyme [Candidatus Sumerlaeota bacterium]